VRDDASDVRHAAVSGESGPVARLAYGAGATITRLNKGLRRRADKTVLGFRIDPVSGYWAKSEDEDEAEPADPTASPRQWIVPAVQDRKNALLFEPAGGTLTATTLATVQHALLRGIEAVFQLEEGEILAEPMPTRDNRKGFLLYEAAEGGAGVLTRLATETGSLPAVALRALEIMHFAVTDRNSLTSEPSALTDVQDTACVAACYRCLMSYYNQPDHEILDRRDEPAQEMLLRIARGATNPERPAAPDRPQSTADIGEFSEWRAEALRRGIPRPDADPVRLGEHSVPLVWRHHYVAVLLDGSDADLHELDALGFEVIAFRDRDGWDAAFRRLARAVGRNA
jgi:hypothetical protein